MIPNPMIFWGLFVALFALLHVQSKGVPIKWEKRITYKKRYGIWLVLDLSEIAVFLIHAYLLLKYELAYISILMLHLFWKSVVPINWVQGFKDLRKWSDDSWEQSKKIN